VIRNTNEMLIQTQPIRLIISGMSDPLFAPLFVSEGAEDLQM
jgi:hypothetical protein